MPASDRPQPAPCPECGHQHQGASLAFICIGCPCPERPQPPAPASEAPQPPALTAEEIAEVRALIGRTFSFEVAPGDDTSARIILAASGALPRLLATIDALRAELADTHQRLECREVERDAARLRALRAEQRIREIAEVPCAKHPVHREDPDACAPADRCTFCRCRAFVGQLGSPAETSEVDRERARAEAAEVVVSAARDVDSNDPPKNSDLRELSRALADYDAGIARSRT